MRTELFAREGVVNIVAHKLSESGLLVVGAGNGERCEAPCYNMFDALLNWVSGEEEEEARCRVIEQFTSCQDC